MIVTIDHTRKVDKAVRMSGISDHSESAAVMLRAIPDEVIAALPARLIAQLIDANSALAGASKAIAAAEAVETGIIWDARQGRSREIAA